MTSSSLFPFFSGCVCGWGNANNLCRRLYTFLWWTIFDVKSSPSRITIHHNLNNKQKIQSWKKGSTIFFSWHIVCWLCQTPLCVRKSMGRRRACFFIFLPPSSETDAACPFRLVFGWLSCGFVQKADTFIASGITPSPYILDCIALPPLLESPLPPIVYYGGIGSREKWKTH